MKLKIMIKQLLKDAGQNVSPEQRKKNLVKIYGKIGTTALISRSDNLLKKDQPVFRDLALYLESINKQILIIDK